MNAEEFENRKEEVLARFKATAEQKPKPGTNDRNELQAYLDALSDLIRFVEGIPEEESWPDLPGLYAKVVVSKNKLEEQLHPKRKRSPSETSNNARQKQRVRRNEGAPGASDGLSLGDLGSPRSNRQDRRQTVPPESERPHEGKGRDKQEGGRGDDRAGVNRARSRVPDGEEREDEGSEGDAKQDEEEDEDREEEAADPVADDDDSSSDFAPDPAPRWAPGRKAARTSRATLTPALDTSDGSSSELPRKTARPARHKSAAAPSLAGRSQKLRVAVVLPAPSTSLRKSSVPPVIDQSTAQNNPPPGFTIQNYYPDSQPGDAIHSNDWPLVSGWYINLGPTAEARVVALVDIIMEERKGDAKLAEAGPEETQTEPEKERETKAEAEKGTNWGELAEDKVQFKFPCIRCVHAGAACLPARPTRGGHPVCAYCIDHKGYMCSRQKFYNDLVVRRKAKKPLNVTFRVKDAWFPRDAALDARAPKSPRNAGENGEEDEEDESDGPTTEPSLKEPLPAATASKPKPKPKTKGKAKATVAEDNSFDVFDMELDFDAMLDDGAGIFEASETSPGRDSRPSKATTSTDDGPHSRVADDSMHTSNLSPASGLSRASNSNSLALAPAEPMRTTPDASSPQSSSPTPNSLAPINVSGVLPPNGPSRNPSASLDGHDMQVFAQSSLESDPDYPATSRLDRKLTAYASDLEHSVSTQLSISSEIGHTSQTALTNAASALKAEYTIVQRALEQLGGNFSHVRRTISNAMGEVLRASGSMATAADALASQELILQQMQRVVGNVGDSMMKDADAVRRWSRQDE